MTVVEGKWFSQMLASRKTFAENTRPAKITYLSCHPVKKLRALVSLWQRTKMQNEPNLCPF